MIHRNFELSAEAFKGLMENFPRTRSDGWWTAGQIYERKLDRKEDARQAYLQVSKGSRYYRDAQKRISKLD